MKESDNKKIGNLGGRVRKVSCPARSALVGRPPNWDCLIKKVLIVMLSDIS